MEINISQINGFNIVSIDGNEILNVDSYSIRSTRSGETELVLTIKMPDCGSLEISLGGTAEEVASEQADSSAGGCWRIKTYKAGATEAERLYDPAGSGEDGEPG